MTERRSGKLEFKKREKKKSNYRRMTIHFKWHVRDAHNTQVESGEQSSVVAVLYKFNQCHWRPCKVCSSVNY